MRPELIDNAPPFLELTELSMNETFPEILLVPINSTIAPPSYIAVLPTKKISPEISLLMLESDNAPPFPLGAELFTNEI